MSLLYSEFKCTDQSKGSIEYPWVSVSCPAGSSMMRDQSALGSSEISDSIWGIGLVHTSPKLSRPDATGVYDIREIGWSRSRICRWSSISRRNEPCRRSRSVSRTSITCEISPSIVSRSLMEGSSLMTFIKKTAELMNAKIVDLRVSDRNNTERHNSTHSGTYWMTGG